MTNLAHSDDSSASKNAVEEILTVYIANQQFGIPLTQIQDVIRPQNITPVPLSADQIEGALNLRGRIVTAIDIRKRLKLPEDDNASRMSVVVEHDGELFSLLIDKVADVLQIDKSRFDKVPNTLDPIWQDVALGIFRLENELLIVLDVSKLLDLK